MTRDYYVGGMLHVPDNQNVHDVIRAMGRAAEALDCELDIEQVDDITEGD
jgi:hypothetical protein